MIPLRASEIARIAGGELSATTDPDTLVTAPAEYDSRRITPGGLFAAFVGEKVDGHTFAESAHRAGASLTLATQPVSVPAVYVDDVRDALGALAAAVMRSLPNLRVVGITGSSGKTTTKDLLTQILACAGSVVAPLGSLNNELGVPTTALRATEETRFLVLELGARNVGHIRYLTDLVQPHVGVVLNVGSAHVGKFGSMDRTALAKGELIEALPSADAGGVAVLNADDDRVHEMQRRTHARVVTFGEAPAATVRVEKAEMTSEGCLSFVLHTPEGESAVQLRVPGVHQLNNALAVAAAVYACEVPHEVVVHGLNTAELMSESRMSVMTWREDVLLIDDAYNANPESMLAALHSLAELARERSGHRWAVLGQMAELGSESDKWHMQVGRVAHEVGVDRLVLVGEDTEKYAEGYIEAQSGEIPLRCSVEELPQLLTQHTQSGDTVLFKASNAVGLHSIAQKLDQ